MERFFLTLPGKRYTVTLVRERRVVLLGALDLLVRLRESSERERTFSANLARVNLLAVAATTTSGTPAPTARKENP